MGTNGKNRFTTTMLVTFLPWKGALIFFFLKDKQNYGQVGQRRWQQAAATDLHSAFDQIEGNDSCVCGATAQNPTKATQDEILL